jgi:cytochrome c oxidase assembly factor CtaG
MTLAYAHGIDVLGVRPVAEAAAAHAPQLSLLLEWTFDPTFLVPLLLALLYFRGYVRYRRRGGRRFPAWRPALFTLGVLVVGIALDGPIDVLSDESFTFHMVQHDLLMLVAVPLILLGAPFIPVIRGLPAGLRRRWFVPLARRGPLRSAAMFLTRPLVGLVLFEATVVAWHVPGLYNAALDNEWIHYGEHLMFVVTAVCFWWNIVTPYPFPSRLHTFLRMAMLVASAVVNGALASMITFAGQVLYGYGELHGFWGMSMLEDQNLGGLLMWVMGDMLRLTAITVLFAVYAQRENAKEYGPSPMEGRARAGLAHSA